MENDVQLYTIKSSDFICYGEEKNLHTKFLHNQHLAWLTDLGTILLRLGNLNDWSPDVFLEIKMSLE